MSEPEWTVANDTTPYFGKGWMTQETELRLEEPMQLSGGDYLLPGPAGYDYVLTATTGTVTLHRRMSEGR